MAQPSKTTASRASTHVASEPVPAGNGSGDEASHRRPPAKKAVPARNLKVREGESPWTTAELNEVRAELDAEESRLRREIAIAEQDLAAMLRDAGDGAGDDQADAGSKTFEREQEMSLANNARDMLVQIGHAMQRMDNGTYGVCESCGNAVGKARLQAFPRATLCLTCKQREERR